MKSWLGSRLVHWKQVPWNPFAVIYGIYGGLAFLTWIRDEVVKRRPGEPVWHIADYLPRWSAWQWVSGALIIGVILILESSYRRKKAADGIHAGEIEKLHGGIRDGAGEIKALKAKLREGPTVILSNVGGGINLRVESLGQDAINVRLVHVESRNYYLNSDIVRVLRVGGHENFILHCHPMETGGSLVLQAFSSPTLFFNDLYPVYDGTDTRAALEHAMTMLTERQLAVPIELAYSNLSGTQHYRSSFRLRWDRQRESIIDVEPVETRLDDNPPTTAPPNVIPNQFAQLDFQEWHAGDTRGFPNRYGEGHPSWIAVMNRQAAPARNATNVTARLEFVDSSGTTRFCVPHAEWYQMQRFGNSGEVQQWRDDTTIDGGDEQSFVLFAQNDNGGLVVHKHAAEPIGRLDYDRWRIRIIVTSDDAQGFEGELRFTLTRNSLEPDRPAFTRIRTIAPLVTAAQRS
jgi:hypothetical protein